MTSDDSPPSSAPVLLIGLGKIGFSILQLLQDIGVPAVVVTREVPADWESRTEALAARIIRGDARSENVLSESLTGARVVIIATNDDLVNLEILLDVQRLAPDVPVVVRMLDLGLAERVKRDFRVRAALNAAEISTPAFVAAALGEDLLRAFDVGGVSLHLVARRSTGGDRNIVALRSTGGDFSFLPAGELQDGTEVICADVQRQGAPEHASRRAQGRSIWTRPRLSPWRFVWGAVRHASGAMRWLLFGLIGIVIASTFVFHSAMRLSWVDAFYFTVTIITTVGFGDIHLADAPAWVKLYGCGLMLAGVSSLLLLYGLFTDYLVRLRVEEAIGLRRTTLRNHVIIAGAGDLGGRVARRLHALRIPVLALEREPDSGAGRSLSPEIPVMTGDATHAPTLERAGLKSARAVLALTDDDMSNLRIAHITEEVNPRARTVVRLFKSRLAAKLGSQLLGIDLPLNPSEAAAATFVACALKPDVIHGFKLGNRLLMLRRTRTEDLGIGPGKTAEKIRGDQCVLPLLREARGGGRVQPVTEKDVLTPGETVIVLEQYGKGGPKGNGRRRRL